MIDVTGAALPSSGGQATLLRWQEWIVIPGWHLGAPDTNWTGFAVARHLPVNLGAGNVWRTLGNISAVFRVIDAKQVLDVQPAIGAGGTREVVHVFDPTLSLSPIDFHASWGPALELAPAVQPALAVSLMAWVRKKNPGDAPGARQFFGFLNQGDVNWSRRCARLGLAGDGVGGFRFQSNNCPGAPAGANENAQTDVDANAVQPAVLVAPGVNWFHVRLKAIPATESAPGRFLAFLNGRLVATFSLAANLPQSSRSAIDVLQAAFWPIMPAICAWGHPDTVTLDPGYYLRDVRVRYEEDWTDAAL